MVEIQARTDRRIPNDHYMQLKLSIRKAQNKGSLTGPALLYYLFDINDSFKSGSELLIELKKKT